MRQFAVFLGALFVVLGLAIPFIQPQSVRRAVTTSNGLRASCGRGFDLGSIKGGQTYELLVQLSNDGRDYILLTSTQVSCGCTVAGGSFPAKLLPGKAFDIPIEWTPANQLGNQRQQVSVLYTENGIQNFLPIRIEGTANVISTQQTD